MSLLKQAKEIAAIAKGGKVDDALAAFAKLVAGADFSTHPIEERRQVLKMIVNAKVPPHMPSKALVETHRAAIAPLDKMVAEANHPADYELLGICCVFTGDEKRAADVFREGLRLAREQNAASDLCGSLMKWVAAV